MIRTQLSFPNSCACLAGTLGKHGLELKGMAVGYSIKMRILKFSDKISYVRASTGVY